MRVHFDIAAWKENKLWELGLRFVFGGIICVVAGLVAHAYGPVIGGLFLGFPAILPASLTLAKHHQGRMKAVAVARGALVGGVGLAAFALVVRTTAASWTPWIVLACATVAWAVVGFGAWALMEPGPRPPAPLRRTSVGRAPSLRRGRIPPTTS